MKLNFKKAGARILLVVFFSSLLIISCEKNGEFVQPDAKTQNHEFFKHQKTGGDEFKSYILDCLAQADDSLYFSGDFVDTYGLPQWDSGMHFGNEEYNSLIIPIYDKKNKAISALYYLHYQNQYIKSYILMNDEDDAAYEYSKRLIQYFEKTLNLETSNKEFDLIILENNDSQTKSVKSNIAIDYLICDTYWYKASTTDFTHYWSEEDCFISTEYLFQEHHSSGGWASSNVGNYSTNSPYGGGNSGNSNSNIEEPNTYPSPPVETTQEFDDSKAGCIYKEMRRLGHEMFPSTLTNELLRGFEYDASKFEIVYEMSTSLARNKLGLSTLSEKKFKGKVIGYRNVIYINANIIDNRNFLQIGNTIFHETLHAYMKGMLYDKDLQVDISDFDFQETYDFYKKNYPEKQHEHAMWVDNYRHILEKSLWSLYNNAPAEYQNSILNELKQQEGRLGDLNFFISYLANSGLKKVDNNTFIPTPVENSLMELDIIPEILRKINKNCPY